MVAEECTDQGAIQVESFGNQPLRVMNVAPEKVQGKEQRPVLESPAR